MSGDVWNAQAAWLLKLRALSAQARVDELEVDLGDTPESALSDAAIASAPRPGTSLKSVGTDGNSGNPAIISSDANRALRPSDAGGRPLSAFSRPATGSSRASLRTAHTARPAGTATGRFVRLGTPSMVTGDPDEFVSVSRLNYSSYAKRPCLSRALFEWLYWVRGDIRHVCSYSYLTRLSYTLNIFSSHETIC